MKSTDQMILLVSVLLLVHVIPGNAFWDRDQILVESTNIRNIQADVTCRVNCNNVSVPKLRKPGVDGWLSYTSDVNETSKAFVKYYQFNNKYPRDDIWFPELQLDLSVLDSCSQWGQSIQGYYYKESMNASTKQPNTYCSYLELNGTERRICLSRIHITGSDEYFCPDRLTWSPVGIIDETCRTELIVVDDDVFVVWDEIDPQTSKRSIIITAFNVLVTENTDGEVIYTYSPAPNETLVTGIPSVVDYDVCMYSEQKRKTYHGVVTWQFRYYPSIDNIRGKGFLYAKDDSEFSAPNEYLLLAETTQTPAFYKPSLLQTTSHLKQNTGVQIIASWLETDPGADSEVNFKALKFNNASTGWLDLSGDIQGAEVGNLPVYSIAADEGFMRPENMDVDPQTNQLAFVQMANHRINCFEDPYPESQGVWIAELYNSRAGNTGSVIRIHDDVLTRFRQMTWLVY
ncbi:hypothetical protein K8T06_17070, partial [bacterium]|nr:hypothetical protein [bacterium]